MAPGAVGGLEAVVTALAGGMARRGHRVRVLALLDRAGVCEPFRALETAGVELVEIRLPARSYRVEVKRLTGELSPGGGWIAHSHGYHADLVGLCAAKKSGCPIISTIHGFTGNGLKNLVYEWVDRQALTRFDGVIAVSQPLARQLRDNGLRAERVHLIPNAYSPPGPLLSRTEARRILGIPEEALVAGWVGRLSREKGPDMFLESLPMAPGWQASFIGDGPLQPALRKRARGLGVEPRVRWHGLVQGAGRLLAAFDALLLSSRTEGTPIVLLEGMAAGVPLVATAVGGVPDVVSVTEAVLVSPERPDQLAAALREIRARPEEARERARAARARLESDCAVEEWLDRHETVYREVSQTVATR